MNERERLIWRVLKKYARNKGIGARGIHEELRGAISLPAIQRTLNRWLKEGRASQVSHRGKWFPVTLVHRIASHLFPGGYWEAFQRLKLPLILSVISIGLAFRAGIL